MFSFIFVLISPYIYVWCISQFINNYPPPFFVLENDPQLSMFVFFPFCFDALMYTSMFFFNQAFTWLLLSLFLLLCFLLHVYMYWSFSFNLSISVSRHTEWSSSSLFIIIITIFVKAFFSFEWLIVILLQSIQNYCFYQFIVLFIMITTKYFYYCYHKISIICIFWMCMSFSGLFLWLKMIVYIYILYNDYL